MVFFEVGFPKFVTESNVIEMADQENTIRLTTKEQRILQLVAAGRTSPQIAEELCLSLPTIKWYRKGIRIKFEADTTVEVVRKAIESGII